MSKSDSTGTQNDQPLCFCHEHVFTCWGNLNLFRDISWVPSVRVWPATDFDSSFRELFENWKNLQISLRNVDDIIRWLTMHCQIVPLIWSKTFWIIPCFSYIFRMIFAICILRVLFCQLSGTTSKGLQKKTESFW